uniref:Uncharacterized protein n=2 Tax=Aegilops tauschii subsp. strangulata TaxID=200361 RepID=A0A453K5U1_AEGTS
GLLLHPAQLQPPSSDRPGKHASSPATRVLSLARRLLPAAAGCTCTVRILPPRTQLLPHALPIFCNFQSCRLYPE